MSNSTVEFVEVQGIKVEPTDDATWIKNSELSEFIIINSNRNQIKSDAYIDENTESNFDLQSGVKLESDPNIELPRCSVITEHNMFKLDPENCDLIDKSREHLESFGMVFNEEIIDHTESGHCEFISNVNKTGFDLPEGEYVIEVAQPPSLSAVHQDIEQVPATPPVGTLTKQTDLTFTRLSCNICHTPYYSQRGLQAHLRYTHRPTFKYMGDYSDHRFKPYATPEKYTSASILAPSPSGKLCSIKPKKLNKNNDNITNNASIPNNDLMKSNCESTAIKPISQATNTTNVIKSINNPAEATKCHKVISPVNNKGPYYQCPKCSTKFMSEISLRLHYSKTHDDKSIVIAMPGPYVAPYLVNNAKSKMYSSVPGTKVSQSDEVQYFHCTQCTTRFLNENSLKRHFSNIHGHVPFKKK